MNIFDTAAAFLKVAVEGKPQFECRHGVPLKDRKTEHGRCALHARYWALKDAIRASRPRPCQDPELHEFRPCDCPLPKKTAKRRRIVPVMVKLCAHAGDCRCNQI